MKKFKLEEHNRTEPLGAPEGYFETFSKRLDQRLADRREQRFGNEVSFSRYRAIAAAVIGIIFLSWFGYLTFRSEPQTAEMLLAEVSQQDLAAYLDNDDFDIEDVTAIATDDILELTPESIDDALGSLEDSEVGELYNDFGISKEDTL